MSQTTPAWPTYRRLLGFATKYRGLLAIAALGMLLEAAAGGAFTWLMQPIIDQTFVVGEAGAQWWMPAAIVGLFVLRGIAGYLADYYMARSTNSPTIAAGIHHCAPDSPTTKVWSMMGCISQVNAPPAAASSSMPSAAIASRPRYLVANPSRRR